jgi:short-subunit dehydrogenase
MAEGGRTALITGASNGIGYEVSRLYAADGYNLVLVARSTQRLNEIAADFRETYRVNVMPLAKDLSFPGAADEIWSTLQSQSITIDALVNSAGYGMHGPMAEDDLAEELNMLQVNVVALTRLTRLFLPRACVQTTAGPIVGTSVDPCARTAYNVL